MSCLVCKSSKVVQHSVHDGINYFECRDCGSISVDRAVLHAHSTPERSYNEDYWKSELQSARARSFGSSIIRVAETLLYSRIPVTAFVDIGSGPGYLLDSLATLLPEFSSNIHGIELFPPPEPYRSKHPNYRVGRVSDLQFRVSAGVCVEVIEHLFPETLEQLIVELSNVAEPGAIFFFNSGQPDYVNREDPHYLDPFGRGHIVAYSVEGLKPIFEEHGFRLFRLPGRSWGFLAEFRSQEDHDLSADELLTRLWTAHPDNIAMLNRNTFGPMLHTMGIESARCYLEAERASR